MNLVAVAIAVAAALCCYWMHNKTEKFGGSSPGALIQLSSSSGYYPYYRYDYGYRPPYYRYRYPFYQLFPMGYQPAGYGNFKYGLY